MISLPQETFTPYGAGLKSSILFLEKRAIPIVKEGQQLEINQIVVEEEEYKVYMARIDDIGYDGNGRLRVSEEQAYLPSEVEKSITTFTLKLSLQGNGRYCCWSQPTGYEEKVGIFISLFTLGEANINQNLVKLTPKPEVNPYYLALFSNIPMGRIQTERTASKSVVPIVNYYRLRKLLVPLPPRFMQDHIAQAMQDTYANVKRLRTQAETIVAEAKARVERMILGEEDVA